MMKDNKESYAIAFTGIELVYKSLQEPIEIKEGLDLKFNYNFFSDLRLFPNGKNAFVLTEITISEATEMIKLASFKTLCSFNLPDFENIFKLIEVNMYDIPLNLEITLKSAALSTTRGIVYSELRGTYLNNAILPLIDIASVIINDRNKAIKKEN